MEEGYASMWIYTRALSICLCVCVCVCVRIYIHTCIHICVHAHICMCVCVCVCVCMDPHPCLSVCLPGCRVPADRNVCTRERARAGEANAPRCGRVPSTCKCNLCRVSGSSERAGSRDNGADIASERELARARARQRRQRQRRTETDRVRC